MVFYMEYLIGEAEVENLRLDMRLEVLEVRELDMKICMSLEVAFKEMDNVCMLVLTYPIGLRPSYLRQKVPLSYFLSNLLNLIVLLIFKNVKIMSTSVKRNLSVAIKSIEQDRMGQLVVVAQPNEFNPTGNYVMNSAQERFLLDRVGIPSRLALKHIVSMSNGTSKLAYTAQFNKAGGEFTRKDGTTGTYTKDWTQFSGFGVELGFASKALVAELSFKHALEHANVFAQAPAVAANNGSGNQTPDPKDTPDPVDPASNEADPKEEPGV